MTPNTLIGRTFGSLTQREREGLPCGTVLRDPTCPQQGRAVDYFDRVLLSNGDWRYLDGDASRLGPLDDDVIASIPTTPDPDEAKAREALAEYDRRCQQEHDEDDPLCTGCGAALYLLDGCEWPAEGPRCAACSGADLDALRAYLRTALRLLDAERALVAGVRREERAAPTPETLASPLLRHRDVLTTRTLSTLINRGINTVGELAALPDGYGTAKQPGILRLAGIGRKSRNECGELLRSLGLTWGHGAIDSGAHVLPEDAP